MALGFPRHKSTEAIPQKHFRRLEDEIRSMDARLRAAESSLAGVSGGGIEPAYIHVYSTAAVDIDGLTWEAITARFTLVDGVSASITRSGSVFTFPLPGKYAWELKFSGTADGANLYGVRIREGSTTLASQFFNTISSTTNQGGMCAIVSAAEDATQTLQICAGGLSSNLPQITIDSQVMGNLNLSIVRITAS